MVSKRTHYSKLVAWLCLFTLSTAMLSELVKPARATSDVESVVDVFVELEFGAESRLQSISMRWLFDEPYEKMALEGLDLNKDGEYSASELAELAKVNVDGLRPFNYFTTISFGKVPVPFHLGPEYTMEKLGEARLTLSFALDIDRPPPVAQHNGLITIGDASRKIAFQLQGDTLRVIHAEGGKTCSAAKSRSAEIGFIDISFSCDGAAILADKAYFVFGDGGVVHSSDGSLFVRIGERIPVVDLRRRFAAYNVTATAYEDCLVCAVVEGPAGTFQVNYDESGTLVQSILSDDKGSHDVLGNAVGSRLVDVMGEKGTCDVGMFMYCKSNTFSKLHYIVREDESCLLQSEVQRETPIPPCARIDGFIVQ